MRSILEEAIVALLNEDHDKANQLMHRFMLGRARQIHESLRHGDESVLDETWNDELTEEYFTEDDLDGLEGGDTDLDDDATDELADTDTDFVDGGEDVDPVDADVDAADDLSDDMGTDDTMEVSPEAMDTIRDDLAKLMADFEAEMGLGSDDVDASALPSDDVDADADADLDSPDMDGDLDSADVSEPTDDVPAEFGSEDEDEMHESEGDDEDDFADMVESITSELAKVGADLTKDGVEFGGKTITQNRTSALPSKKADASDAKPITIKSSTHTGYERETAPAVKDMAKKSRNVNAKADAGRTTVSKDGDKSSLLNKDFASGK